MRLFHCSMCLWVVTTNLRYYME